MPKDPPNAKKRPTVEAPVVGARAGLLGERLPFVPPGICAFLLVPTAFVGKHRRLYGLPRYVLGMLLKDRRALGGRSTLSVAASLVLCALFVSWRFVARATSRDSEGDAK